MRRVMQVLIQATDADHANDLTQAFGTQVGLLGMRTLNPAPSKPTWRVQCFFEAPTDDVVPDGCQIVTCPESLLNRLR